MSVVDPIKDNLDDRSEKDGSNEKEDVQFLRTSYSFLAGGWKDDNIVPFAYGLLVYAFQITFLVLMICSKIVRSMSANEDTDNPDEEGFAAYMPANATLVVRTTQFVAIIAFVFFPEDSIDDVVDAVRYFPLTGWYTDHKFISLSCILQFSQGFLSCFTVYLLVMTSSDVIDIVLNFAAVNFISRLDEKGFELAVSGRYGNLLKKKAILTPKQTTDYKCFNHWKDEKVVTKDVEGEGEVQYVDIIYKWYIPTVSVIAIFLLVFSLYVLIQQSVDGKWEAPLFRVEFDEETGLLGYSGCYDDVGVNKDRRATYKSRNYTQQSPLLLEYCQESRRWVFYEEPGNPCNSSDFHKAQSVKTNSFSVTTAFELNWISPFKKPIDMYFLGDTEEDLLFCNQFSDDGICNVALNNYDFKFDGGDCCGTTCSKPDCGKNTLFEAFGQNFTNDAIGYPNCEVPGKVDLTVALPAADFQDKLEDDLDTWITFWSPSLELQCGEQEKRIVFSIPVSESMFGNNYSNVKVESDSVCDLIASNLEPFFVSLKESFSVADISIDGIDTVTVDVLSQNSIPIEFDSLGDRSSLVFTGDYNLEGMIPTEIGSMTSLKELNLAKNYLSGTIPTDIGKLLNLATLLLDNNQFTGSIPSEVTSLLDMTTLKLDNNYLKGTIPAAIGLLTKLTYLDLQQNGLTGLVPSSINSLSNLKYLYLNGNNLKGSVDCSNFNEIWDEELCQTLNSFPRWDSESPTTSPAPSDAPSVSNAPSANAPSVSPAPTISPPPTASPTQGCYSLAEIICEQNDFVQMCTLMRLVDTAEELLSSNSTWTIFAPTNEGFNRYYTENGVKFNFEDIFWFHAVKEEKIFKRDLPCTTGSNLIEMRNGRDSRTLCDRENTPLGQKGIGNDIPVPFVSFDMVACNGVIHTISDVLLD